MRSGWVMTVACGVAVMAALAGSAMAQYSGGSGDPNDPWQIADPNDLIAMGANTQHYGDYFILTADIDMAGAGPEPDGSFTTAVIAPAGSPDFTGTLDGDGHVIRNLVIGDGRAGNDYLGLFGYVSSGDISNLGLEDGSVTGDAYVGALAGMNYGTITSCYATGEVSGAYYGGGLVGLNYGTITSCYAAGQVNGVDLVGGLVGYNSSGAVTSCYTTGQVSGVNLIGGLVGFNDSGPVASCYATGQVSGVDLVGGLVGYSYDGAIGLCFWDVETSGVSVSDGGFGRTTTELQSAATFWGWGDGQWTIAEGADYPHLAWENAGGVVIDNLPARSYGGAGTQDHPFVIATAADLTCMTGRMDDWDEHFVLASDIDMAAVGVYLPPVGFSGILAGGGHVISNLTINEPCSSVLGLLGSLAGGEIRNLGIEGGSVSGVNYVGRLVGCNWYGTVTSCYATGDVTGNGDYIGSLVGYNDGGTVISCYAIGDVTGNGDYVGSLVGYNDGGTVISCYATGDVTGDYDVGGLAGCNYYGTITSCYVTGNVTGDCYVGGLVGYNDGGTVISCYATGDATGDFALGGLVGSNSSGTVTSCYATGTVTGDANVGGLTGVISSATISFCYFLDTAGPANGLGTPLSDSAMRLQASFVGWDFVGAGDGDEDIWAIHEGLTSPYLSWQSGLVGSMPFTGKTVAKAGHNVIWLSFDSPIALGTQTPLHIVPIAGGNDVGSDFVYSVHPNGATLKAVENGNVLANQTWYRVTPTASFAVDPFVYDVCTLIGDANADGRVMAVDLGVIWSHNGELTDARYDINGDGRVMAVDLGVAWGHNGETVPPKP